MLAVQVLRYQIDIAQQQAAALTDEGTRTLQQQQQLSVLHLHDSVHHLQQQQPGLIDSSNPAMPPLAQHRQGYNIHADSHSSNSSVFAAAALQRRAVSQSQILPHGSSSSAAALATAASAARVSAADTDRFSRRGSDRVTPRASASRASWAASAPNSSRNLGAAVAAGLASSSSCNMPGQLPPLGPNNMGASAVAAIEKLLRSDSYNHSSSSAAPLLAHPGSRNTSFVHGQLDAVAVGGSSMLVDSAGSPPYATHAGSMGGIARSAGSAAQSACSSSSRQVLPEPACSADKLHSMLVRSTAGIAALGIHNDFVGAASYNLPQQQQQSRQPSQSQVLSSRCHSSKSLFDYADTSAIVPAGSAAAAAAGRVGDYSSCAADIPAQGCSSTTSGSSSGCSSGDGGSSGMRADVVKAMHEARRAEDLRQRAAELEQARR
jgi:hypothetical protein